MTATTSISSNTRPREFLAEALRSMYGPDASAGGSAGADQESGHDAEPSAAEDHFS